MTHLIDAVASFFSPTHLLAIVAIGLLSGRHVKRVRGIALAAFALGLAVGSIMIAAAVRETPAALALLAIAALAAVAVVTFIATKADGTWQRIGVRIVSSWIAASAILVLALRLAR